MDNLIEVVLEADFGAFFPAEANVERFSYPFITPAAARGCLENILRKPEFRYEITEIQVLSKIEHFSFKVNEVNIVTSGDSSKFTDQKNQQILFKPAYLIKARIYLTKKGIEGRDSSGGPNTVKKYIEMFNRRVEKEQSWETPCFGQMQYPATFRKPTEHDRPISDNRIEKNMVYDHFDLSLDIDGNSPRKPTRFDAVMKNGVIHIPSWKEILEAQKC